MKRFIVLGIMFIIVLSGCTLNLTSDYDSFFDDSYISEINIELSKEDYQDILDAPTAEEYKSANIVIDNQEVGDVGFRTKGNSSLSSVASSDSDRYSYHIKVDKYVDNQTTLEGVTDFVLNNMYSDPTYMREYISYKVLNESGLPAPDCKYIKVSINGEYKGLYLMVESIGNSFLENNFGDDSGNLYKADEGSTLLEGSEDNLKLKSGDDKDKEGLENLIKILNDEKSTQEDIEQIMDVESFLRNIAFNTVFGSYDSYNGNLAHNYYLYEVNSKFYMIPWDYNMAFAGFNMSGDTSVIEIPIYEPLSGSELESRPVVNKLLSFDEYKNEYTTYIEEYNKYLNEVPSMIMKLDTFIGEEIKNDPTSFYTYEEYKESITNNEDYEFTISEGKDNMKMPEGMKMPEDGEMPEGMAIPEGGEIPGGMAVLEDGEIPEGMGENALDSTPPPILNYVQDRYKFITDELKASAEQDKATDETDTDDTISDTVASDNNTVNS